MKKKLLIFSILVCLIFSGCSGSDSGLENGAGFTTSKDETSFDGVANDGTVVEDVDQSDNLEVKDNNQDMLVYRANISIDTLDYAKSVKDFKELLEKKKGYIESEEFNDGNSSYDYYYVDEDDKHKEYTATVRVPSSDYENILNSLGDLGDVRSQTSSIENVTQDYMDANTALQIYKEKEQRYINMIADAQDEATALQLEQNLTEVEIQIAQLESRINNIETDVAYSYIYITIKEVRKYSNRLGVSSTFGERLIDTFGESWSDFFYFLQDLVLWFISAFPYLLLLGVVIVILHSIRKYIRKKYPNRMSRRERRRLVEEAIINNQLNKEQ